MMTSGKKKVDYGIAIPQIFPGGKIDAGYIGDFLRKVEALGYHSVWVQENTLGRANALDPVLLLTYAAALTTRVKLAQAVLVTTLISPVHMAKYMVTLDHLSKGRLIVGVGLGGNFGTYPAFGISPQGRAGRFEEGVKLMKALWTQESVTFQGKFWQLNNATMNPKPLQKPHPPLWFGGASQPAINRAVRLGDGWIAQGSASTVSFKEQAKIVRQALQMQGKDPSRFPIGKRVYIAVDNDRERALHKLEGWFAHRYGRAERAKEVSVFGTVQQCVDGLSEILDVGVDLIQLNPVEDDIEQAEILWRDVIPVLPA